MGNKKLNSLLKAEQHWSDKKAGRHKHNYKRECYLELTTMQDKKPVNCRYYHIMMCTECYSFNSIATKGSVLGLVNTLPKNADIVKCHSSCKMLGFNRLIFEETQKDREDF